MGTLLSTAVQSRHSLELSPCRQLRVASVDMQGLRPAMEDATVLVHALPNHPGTSFVAIYDGHGGDQVAEMCARLLHAVIDSKPDPWNPETIVESVLELDEIVRQKVPHADTSLVGSCVLLALVDAAAAARGGPEVAVLVAHAGDSRAVLVRADGSFQQLTEDHKPTLPREKARIVAAGGRVESSRVMGQLAVSRAVGDYSLKKSSSLVLAVCETCGVALRPGDALLLGCDGVFEGMSTQHVVTALTQADARFRAGGSDNWSQPVECLSSLLKAALAARTTDNQSVALVAYSPGGWASSSPSSSSLSSSSPSSPSRSDAFPAPGEPVRRGFVPGPYFVGARSGRKFRDAYLHDAERAGLRPDQLFEPVLRRRARDGTGSEIDDPPAADLPDLDEVCAPGGALDLARPLVQNPAYGWPYVLHVSEQHARLWLGDESAAVLRRLQEAAQDLWADLPPYFERDRFVGVIVVPHRSLRETASLSLRFLADEPISVVRRVVAEQLGVPEARQQYWAWSEGRPRRWLSPSFLDEHLQWGRFLELAARGGGGGGGAHVPSPGLHVVLFVRDAEPDFAALHGPALETEAAVCVDVACDGRDEVGFVVADRTETAGWDRTLAQVTAVLRSRGVRLPASLRLAGGSGEQAVPPLAEGDAIEVLTESGRVEVARGGGPGRSLGRTDAELAVAAGRAAALRDPLWGPAVLRQLGPQPGTGDLGVWSRLGELREEEAAALVGWGLVRRLGHVCQCVNSFSCAGAPPPLRAQVKVEVVFRTPSDEERSDVALGYMDTEHEVQTKVFRALDLDPRPVWARKMENPDSEPGPPVNLAEMAMSARDGDVWLLERSPD